MKFTLVVKWSIIHIVVDLVAQKGWQTTHKDVKIAYLYDDLKEVYMSQSKGFFELEREYFVYRL